MAALPNARLRSILGNSLPGYTEAPAENPPKPSTFRGDQLGDIAIYLWTVTPDQSASGRPEGEHKAQIILPHTTKGDSQYFELDGERTAFLLGWSPTFGVFVLWEIQRHQGAAYSKNIQVRNDLLQLATESGWAVAKPRNLQNGLEVRCAVHPAHLERLLVASHQADEMQLEGRARQVFLESSAPEFPADQQTFDPTNLDPVQQKRRLIEQQRLARSSKFAADVLPMYGFRCAICEVQLNVVEAAHILPVHDPRSRDEPWNGLALCRNHHKLYDSRILLINRDTVVSTDDATLELLRDIGRNSGLEALVYPYSGRPIAILPTRFQSDADFRQQMQNALELKFAL